MENKVLKAKTVAIGIGCLIALMIWGCSDNRSKRTGFTPGSKASTSFTQGEWLISSFQLGAHRQKVSFAGYRFAFEQDNRVKVYAGDKLFTGEWWVTQKTKGKDSQDSNLIFNLMLPHTEPLKYLNRKWEILERKPNLLRLLSTETGDWEYVVFEKI